MNTTTATQDSMRKINKYPNKQPILPALLAIPVASIPEKYSAKAIVKSLNIMLAQSLDEGDLDFLEGQNVSVEIVDLKLKFGLSLGDGILIASSWQTKDSLNLSGNLYDFMLLASRKEDSDALFFHRRLKMEGSTNLGLEVKNLLDGMDLDTVRFHKLLDFALHHCIKVFEKLFK
ncbi:MAG: SCP2 sterol-binding domain-containing protein [Alcanivoracaceae bacterium]|nr:SCP2 sterol-binding domain-containing protein [Alcanivoracaceae bacterium]